MYYVYYLNQQSDITIGCTTDLASLLDRDTRPRYFMFTNRDTARSFERYLRSSSGKAFVRTHDFRDLFLLANALQYAYERTIRKVI